MYNKHLDTFISVADLGSFSKAAEEQYISPTAVIKQIDLLEQELGLKLMERTHRGIKLTKAGESVYNDAKYIIQYSKDSLVRANNAMQDKEKVIRIGTSPMTPGHFIMELWNKVKKMCPDMKFRLVPYDNTPENAREILKNLGQNIDIVAGWFDEEFLENRGCSALKLEDEPLHCALSVNHPLAEKEKLKITDLHGETVMLIRRGWNRYTDAVRDMLWENHPQVKIADVPFFNMDVLNMCESGTNILVAFGKWENVHPLLKVIPVDWSYTIPFGILHSPNPSPFVQEFLTAVSKVYN